MAQEDGDAAAVEQLAGYPYFRNYLVGDTSYLVCLEAREEGGSGKAKFCLSVSDMGECGWEAEFSSEDVANLLLEVGLELELDVMLDFLALALDSEKTKFITDLKTKKLLLTTEVVAHHICSAPIPFTLPPTGPMQTKGRPESVSIWRHITLQLMQQHRDNDARRVQAQAQFEHEHAARRELEWALLLEHRALGRMLAERNPHIGIDVPALEAALAAHGPGLGLGGAGAGAASGGGAAWAGGGAAAGAGGTPPAKRRRVDADAGASPASGKASPAGAPARPLFSQPPGGGGGDGAAAVFLASSSQAPCAAGRGPMPPPAALRGQGSLPAPRDLMAQLGRSGSGAGALGSCDGGSQAVDSVMAAVADGRLISRLRSGGARGGGGSGKGAGSGGAGGAGGNMRMKLSDGDRVGWDAFWHVDRMQLPLFQPAEGDAGGAQQAQAQQQQQQQQQQRRGRAGASVDGGDAGGGRAAASQHTAPPPAPPMGGGTLPMPMTASQGFASQDLTGADGAAATAAADGGARTQPQEAGTQAAAAAAAAPAAAGPGSGAADSQAGGAAAEASSDDDADAAEALPTAQELYETVGRRVVPSAGRGRGRARGRRW